MSKYSEIKKEIIGFKNYEKTYNHKIEKMPKSILIKLVKQIRRECLMVIKKEGESSPSTHTENILDMIEGRSYQTLGFEPKYKKIMLKDGRALYSE